MGFGYSERDLFEHAITPNFHQLMEFQVRRAKDYYNKAQAALVPQDRKPLLVAEIMRGVYSRILAQIAQEPSRIFDERVRVPSPMKATIAALTWLKIMVQQMAVPTPPKTSVS